MTKTDKNNELDALVRLIDEPNVEMYHTIKERIFTHGMNAIPILESAWENSFDNIIQQRIEELIADIQMENLKKEIVGWRRNNADDLLQGYILITRFQYPDLDEEKIIKSIGRLTQDVWLELNHDLTGLEKAKVINHILFDVHKFRGNKTNISAVDNYFLKSLLETHKGTPLSIGLLYTIIARSLNIPVYGVDLPKHFVLAYSDEGIKAPDQDDVLFYINPFNKGAVFTRNEIEAFVKQLKLKPKESYFKPCDNVTIIKRLINELIQVYGSANQDKVNLLKTIYNLL